MEHKNITKLVIIDLSAAFETVDLKVLLEVLQKCFGVKDFLKSALVMFTQPQSSWKLVFLRDHVLDLACLMHTQVH